MRDDGNDVTFSMPRGLLSGRATTTTGERFGNGATLYVDDVHGARRRPRSVERFLKRVRRAAEWSSTLGDAPAATAGSPPLVIDYALAKGLAHEAFGHAAEADGYRSSVLARDGRLRVGDSGRSRGGVDRRRARRATTTRSSRSPRTVVRRRAARIVEHGQLRDGLSDPWSADDRRRRAERCAARAESFRHPPQPRMTNIRIEVDGAVDVAGDFEDLDPEGVRELLLESDVLRRHSSP